MTVDTIPEGFGELVKPVHAAGQRYLNRVPSWIVVEQVIHLRIWKSFNPNIQVTSSDHAHLKLLSNSKHYDNLRVNMLGIFLRNSTTPAAYLGGYSPSLGALYMPLGGRDDRECGDGGRRQ